MADNVVNLPLRGKTYLSGSGRTIDSTQTTSKAVMGIKKVFKDLDYSATSPSNTSAKAPRSGGEVTCLLVRNSSGRALLPKSAVVWKAGAIGKEVDGFSYVDYQPVAGIVDEWLPASGVPDKDLFWIAVKGPSICLKSADTNTIAYGDYVAAITAAASTTSTTAGRILGIGVTNQSTSVMSAAMNRIGQAMSTSNTSGASTGFLVYLDLLAG